LINPLAVETRVLSIFQCPCGHEAQIHVRAEVLANEPAGAAVHVGLLGVLKQTSIGTYHPKKARRHPFVVLNLKAAVVAFCRPVWEDSCHSPEVREL
jgi:hypothetical protein